MKVWKKVERVLKSDWFIDATCWSVAIALILGMLWLLKVSLRV